MKEPYLIALDLDGTLLREDKTISEETFLYLQNLQREGNIVVLASGRPERGVLPYHQKLRLSSPFVCYNGASLISSDKDFPSQIIQEAKEDILSFLSVFGLSSFSNLFCDTSHACYVYREDKKFESNFHEEEVKIIRGDYQKTLKENVNAFVFEVKDESQKKKILSYQNPAKDIAIRFWLDSPLIGEFIHPHHGKASGIEAIRKHYGILKSHTIAFGDSENDLDMLGSVEYGYAMLNAKEELKQEVKRVSLADNEHDGVKVTLEHFFQEERKHK